MFGWSALLVLGLLEVREQILKAPVVTAEITPGIEVVPMPPGIDHGIERAAAAQDLAARPVEPALVHKRRLYWPRGKVLGGSSSLNAMIYTRGHRHDFDSWRDLGCHDWSFEDLLPYFKKS